MYRLTVVVVLLAALVCPFAAWGQEAEEASWQRDAHTHWHVNQAGEKVDEAPHDMEDVICRVCGGDIWLYEDGSADVYDYTPQGDLTRYTSYDAQGEIVDDYRYRIEYDEEGNKLRETCYYKGALIEEVQYALSSDGSYQPVMITGYDEDGSRAMSQFDGWYNMIRAVSWDSEGNVIFEETARYTYDEQGNILEASRQGRSRAGDGFDAIENQYGDNILYRTFLPDGTVDVEMTHEYTYDDEGNKITGKFYVDGALISESLYQTVDSEWGLYSTEKITTEYLEDGSRCVSEFDQEGSQISHVCYGPDGEILPDAHDLEE